MRRDVLQSITKVYFPSVPRNNLKKALLEIIQDLINDLEADWDYNAIRYETVMTKKEWNDYSQHPERKKYKSKRLANMSLSDRYKYVFEFLSYIFPYYNSLRKSEYKNKLKLGISALITCTLNGRYEIENIRMADTYVGRSAEDRDAGIVNPTAPTKYRIEYALSEYCKLSGKNIKRLSDRISKVSQDRPDILVEYYVTCDIDPEFREDIRQIMKVLGRDLTLSFYNIKLGWEIWKDMRKIGMDVEKFLEFNEFPSYSKVKEKLLNFLVRGDYVEELEKHMKDDLPECYKDYQKSGYVFIKDIFAEEAKRKKYPKKLRSIEEVKAMIKEAEKEVLSYFPLTKRKSPRNTIFNPLHPASTMRAFQSSTRNSKGKRVNSIVMTPRTELLDEYLPILAHETAHAVHKMVLELGEEAGILEKGASELVPTAVLEDFSQLVEGQFHSDKKLPYKKKFHGKEFPNFHSGLTQRSQVPYALVQLGIRKYFDKIWDEGYRTFLTDQMVWEIKEMFDPLIKECAEMGLHIRRDVYDSLGYFSAENPGDGLVYMKKYVVDSPKSVAKTMDEEEQSVGNADTVSDISMSSAFEKKYGKNWISNKEARITLLWLLLESGRNSATETFHKYILTGNIGNFLGELKAIRVEEFQI
ncbi:hypothetical protein JXA34_00485 [Patescibacteria group bacterium]|nr:hypothetical protein [Patescibacteria group bacterium]